MIWTKKYKIYDTNHWKREIRTNARRRKQKQHPETELLLFENYSLSSSTSSSKNNRRILKKCTKNKCICLKEII